MVVVQLRKSGLGTAYIQRGQKELMGKALWQCFLSNRFHQQHKRDIDTWGRQWAVLLHKLRLKVT